MRSLPRFTGQASIRRARRVEANLPCFVLTAPAIARLLTDLGKKLANCLPAFVFGSDEQLEITRGDQPPGWPAASNTAELRIGTIDWPPG